MNGSEFRQPNSRRRIIGCWGVTPFEQSPSVIENATDRQMRFLRTFQNGPRGPLSQKLLNEVARARYALLDEDSRATYDQSLQAPAADIESSSPTAPGTAVPMVAEVIETPAPGTAAAPPFLAGTAGQAQPGNSAMPLAMGETVGSPPKAVPPNARRDSPNARRDSPNARRDSPNARRDSPNANEPRRESNVVDTSGRRNPLGRRGFPVWMISFVTMPLMLYVWYHYFYLAKQQPNQQPVTQQGSQGNAPRPPWIQVTSRRQNRVFLCRIGRT
jgi:hypothetical protein